MEHDENEEEGSVKKKRNKEDILHGNNAAGDDNTTVCVNREDGEPESSTRLAAVEVLAASISEDLHEKLDECILTSRLLQ